MRIVNPEAPLGLYDFSLWDSIVKFKDKLPDEAKQEFSAMGESGKLIAKISWQVSWDATDSVAQAMAFAIFM